MKETLLFFFTLLQLYSASAQRDTRAKLKIHGGIDEVSVSPSGAIWLATSTGNLYYADSATGFWHTHQQFLREGDNFDLYAPDFDRVNFFNSDIGIISGYFSAEGRGAKNGLFRTTDGGKSWKMINFGGDTWIYDFFSFPSGHAWMGGSSGDIYYSSDFGLSWKTLKVSFGSSDRMHSIFMLDSNNGIAGALHNKIFITENNWKTKKSIETPFDQKLYNNKPGEYAQNRIEKIRYWNDYIIVNQEGKFFYTLKNTIKWSEFPFKIIDFELDALRGRLYAFNANNQLASLISPDSFKVVNEKAPTFYLRGFKVINSMAYCLDYNDMAYTITENNYTKTRIYTADIKIQAPVNSKKATFITWGVDGDDIYLSDDFGEKWYRDTVADFYISDFYLKNDSVAIFWTGRDNYIYTLADRKIQEYWPQKPLDDFLKTPVKKITIGSGSVGCFHEFMDKIAYSRVSSSTFQASELIIHDSLLTIEKEFDAVKIEKLLHDINAAPYQKPGYADFMLTEEDKTAYLSYLRSLKNINIDEKGFHEKFIKYIDTIEKAFPYIIEIPESGWSTTSNWYTIVFYNNEGEKLTFYNNYYTSPNPWQVPFTVEYKGHRFKSYDISLQKFIATLLPDNFYGKHVFSNNLLIYKIASLLYENSFKK